MSDNLNEWGEPCGCQAICYQDGDYEILFCKKHAAAPALYEALAALVDIIERDHTTDVWIHPVSENDIYANGKAALALADGDE